MTKILENPIFIDHNAILMTINITSYSDRDSKTLIQDINSSILIQVFIYYPLIFFNILILLSLYFIIGLALIFSRIGRTSHSLKNSALYISTGSVL